MLHELKKPAMRAVPQPSRHLARASGDRLEVQLLASMQSAAAEQQAAQKPMVAL